jgi:large-conductance mechanosensitive channel
MIRVVILFLILTIIVFLTIQGIQKITGKQALDYSKTVLYAMISSAVAIALMFGLVIIF